MELFERLDRGARAEFNFITLICLSTAIAALGLIQNSGAVVIGAMLVAPLMTPMLAAGLGIVQGNIVLFRTSLHSVAVGFLCSLIVGYVFGKVAFPLYSLTPELAARGGPNVLDLIVALLSGVAAAYAMGRPGLLEALPGVAIAAALVPPIATVGISISIGEYGNALGAAMLFGTNLIAIILASAIALYALGIRPRLDEEKSRPWARHILLILSVSVMAIAIPLWGPLAHSEMMEDGRVQKELSVYLSSQSVLVRRVFQNRKNGAQDVYVELIHQKPIPPRIYAGMRKTIRSIVGASADLKVISLKMWEPPVIRSATPPTVPVNKRPTTRRVQPTSRPTP
ncbi:MAG TPA: hypothetical protein DCE42_10975 [Myxococcales bacterium]|nr:hypothetical protein [Myxococcales bacterium]